MTLRKRCKNCLYWENRICHNKHMRIGFYLRDRCKGCKSDIWLDNEGVDVGSSVVEMEEIIDKVLKSVFLRTGKNFWCKHWKSKYEGIPWVIFLKVDYIYLMMPGRFGEKDCNYFIDYIEKNMLVVLNAVLIL